MVGGSFTRHTQATMEEPSFHTHFVTKRGKLFTLAEKKVSSAPARLEGRPVWPGHSSRQVVCGRVTPPCRANSILVPRASRFFWPRGLESSGGGGGGDKNGSTRSKGDNQSMRKRRWLGQMDQRFSYKRSLRDGPLENLWGGGGAKNKKNIFTQGKIK